MTSQNGGWTDEEDAILLAAHREGKTDAEASALLRDRTETACRKRRQRLGAVVAAADPIDRERLTALHEAGRSTAEIAAELGATVRTIQELRWRLGLRVGYDPEEVLGVAATGISTAAVSEQLGVPLATVRRILRDGGVARKRGRPRRR